MLCSGHLEEKVNRESWVDEETEEVLHIRKDKDKHKIPFALFFMFF